MRTEVEIAAAERAEKLSDLGGRRAAIERRDIVESGLAKARTVGDVWRIGRQLAAIDADLDAL